MLRFFRNIRQKLIEQENIRKYFWYAIGEILLVMIGILLALQVNNWNEERIKTEYEQIMLAEILQDLRDDRKDVDAAYLPRLKTRELSVIKMKELIALGTPQPDSAILSLYEGLKTTFFYTFEAGAYESLKSNGLENIQNPLLRRELAQAFETSFTRGKNFIDTNIRLINPYFQNMDTKWFQYSPARINNEMVMKPTPKPGFLQSEELSHLVYLLEYDVDYMKFRLDNLIKVKETLIKLLEEELKARPN